jgi:hypothetical protein
MCFGENLLKPKMEHTNVLVRAKHIFLTHDLDPEGPGAHVVLEPWSIIFKESLFKKVVVQLPNSKVDQV